MATYVGTTSTSMYASSGYLVLMSGSSTLSLSVGTVIYAYVSSAGLRPQTDNTVPLGRSDTRFSAIWATNGTIQTSDARLKTDITPSTLGLNFITKLRPVSYKWIEGGREAVNMTPEDIQYYKENPVPVTFFPQPPPVPGKRTHYGLIAQEVKQVLDELQVPDFGGWIINDVNDPESTQSLRYDEFISPLIKATQELIDINNSLEARIEALEQKIIAEGGAI